MNCIMLRPSTSAGRSSAITLPSRSSCSSQKIKAFTLFQRISSSKQRFSKQGMLTRPATTSIKPTAASSKVVRVSSHFSERNTKHFFTRKQNHLNTCFNIRKSKLKQMTKQNFQLYQRINSQKSLYCNAELNKSYKSTCQIKQMLSQSKLSHRSLSQSSTRKNLEKNREKQQNKKPKMEIAAVNIDKMQGRDLNDIRALFMKADLNTSKDTEVEGEGKGIPRFNFNKRHNSHIMTKLRTKKQMDVSLFQTGQGGLLHRIAEDMVEDKQNCPIKQNSHVFKRKKIFNA